MSKLLVKDDRTGELIDRGNSYKIVKTNEAEKKGQCEGCTCMRKRWLNPRSGRCYYREAIENNYLTKMK